MINQELTKPVVPEESQLKEIVVNYVGNTLNPENEEITVQQVIEVFAKEFPEFLLCLAEENWINGYTQALKDTEYMESQKNEPRKNKNQNQ